MTQAPETCRRCGRDLLHMPDQGNYCCCLKPAAPHTAAPAADRAVSEPGEYMLTDDAFDALQDEHDLIPDSDDGDRVDGNRLRDFADACYSAGWNDAAIPDAPSADRAELARPEIVNRIMAYAGKTRAQVSNPCMTANEAIKIANWIAALARSTDAPSEPVAWRYVPSKVWKDYVFTDDPEKVKLAREFGCEIDALGVIATPPAATTSTQGKLAESASEWKSRAITEACAKWSGAQKIEAGDFIEWLVRFPILASTSTETPVSTPGASGEGAKLPDHAIRAAFSRINDKLGGTHHWTASSPNVIAFAREVLALAATPAPAVPAAIHPQSMHGLVDAAGGTVLTGGGAAFTSAALAKFAVLAAETLVPARTPTAGNTEDARSMGAVSEKLKAMATQLANEAGGSPLAFRTLSALRLAIDAALAQAASTGGAAS